MSTSVPITTNAVTVTDNGSTVAVSISSTAASVNVGTTGAQGATGPGVAAGGTTGQVLVKSSGTDYATTWTSSPTFGTATMTLGTATTLQAGTATLAAASIGSVTNTEIGYLSGVTSGLQSQLAGRAPTTCLWLPGSSGNYVSAPDAAGFNVTDLDIIVRCSLDDWTPSARMLLVDRDSSGAGTRAYGFNVEIDGKLRLIWSNDGTNEVTRTSTAAVPFTNGQAGWVRVTFDIDNGASGNTAKFYTAADQVDVPTSWTQLGSDVVTAGTTTAASVACALAIGAGTNGSSNPLAGKLYRAIVKNGIGGTTVADWRADIPATRYRDAYSNLWTLNGTANAWMVA